MYTRAIQIDPAFGLAYYNRGAAQEMLRKFDETCQDMIQARKHGVDVSAALTSGCN
jgi:hypothetical protein